MLIAKRSCARVLVVDDDPDAANALSWLLASAGFETLPAFDGEAALDAAERFQPDACVLDINMPGLNGYEVGRHLREQFAQRPPLLAAVTGYDDDTHLDRAADAGFALHFTKPANPQDLLEQLRDGLNRSMDRSAAPAP